MKQLLVVTTKIVDKFTN